MRKTTGIVQFVKTSNTASKRTNLYNYFKLNQIERNVVVHIDAKTLFFEPHQNVWILYGRLLALCFVITFDISTNHII
jgi:hypothetical protein